MFSKNVPATCQVSPSEMQATCALCHRVDFGLLFLHSNLLCTYQKSMSASFFVPARTLITPKLLSILTKVHMCLSEPFNRYWRCTRGEKVDYPLKKNWRDLWVTGFSCCVAYLQSRAGKKSTFDCFLVRRSAEFGDSHQPALFCM